mgnify:CR=1 FL=1
MEQESYGTKKELLKIAWQRFIEMGELMPGVRPVVVRSWFRCKKSGLDPYSWPKKSLHNIDNPGDLMMSIERDQAIIKSTLEQTLTWFNTEALLLLVHNSGVIVESVGNLSFPFLPLLQKGQLISEEIFGTFGPVLALQGEELVEVQGYEHFLANLHPYHSVAVHFFLQDELWILGAILPMEQSGPQALGLVQAAVQILDIKVQPPALPFYDRRNVVPLAQLERLEIIKALEVNEGDLVQAALMLGISQTTLEKKIEVYDIELKRRTD